MVPPHPLVVHFFVNKPFVLVVLIGIYIVACKDVDLGAVSAIAFAYLHLTYLSAVASSLSSTDV